MERSGKAKEDDGVARLKRLKTEKTRFELKKKKNPDLLYLDGAWGTLPAEK